MPRRLALVVALVAALACGGLDRDGGVRLPNQMDPVDWGYVNHRNLLGPNEKLLAFYDETVSLDGTVLAIVTDQRVISYNQGNVTAFDLADIRTVERLASFGDDFLITAHTGETMLIGIAPLNGADQFERVLNDAWDRAKAASPPIGG